MIEIKKILSNQNEISIIPDPSIAQGFFHNYPQPDPISLYPYTPTLERSEYSLPILVIPHFYVHFLP